MVTELLIAMFWLVILFIFAIIAPAIVIIAVANAPYLIILTLGMIKIAVIAGALIMLPLLIHLAIVDAIRRFRNWCQGKPTQSNLFAWPPKAIHNYHGSKRWAEAHAAELQNRVGTISEGTIIDSIEVRRYAPFSWGVVERWRYADNPDLGIFGDKNFLMLPKQVRPWT